MPLLNLREAAELAQTSKSSVFRAVKNGRLSAQRTPEGEIRIDPAELTRAFSRENIPLKGRKVSHPVPVERALERDAARADPEERNGQWNDLASRNAALQAKVEALEELVRRLDRDKLDLTDQRDKWQGQAENAQRLLMPPQKRFWWPW